MPDIKRSIVISPAQDAFLNEMGERFGLNRSHLIRIALDKLMRDPPFFVAPGLAIGKDMPHYQQAEAAR